MANQCYHQGQIIPAALVLGFYIMTYVIFAVFIVRTWTMFCNQHDSLPTKFGGDPLF
jgi:hypothetical protein